MSRASVNTYAYGFTIASGVLLADDAALRDLEEALEITQRWSEDVTLSYARWILGVALLHRESPAERERGLAVLGQVRDMCLEGRTYQFMLAAVDVCTSRERARRGDRDGAIPLLREAVDDLFHAGHLWSCIVATGFLVETLLDRGTDSDVAEAEAAIERLAAAPADEGLAMCESGCCGCGLCWRGLRAMTRLMRSYGIATATWRERLASKDISRGPRRCHDGGCPVGGGDVFVHRCRGFDSSVGERRECDAGRAGRP